MACLGEVWVAWTGRFALRVFDGSRKEGGGAGVGGELQGRRECWGWEAVVWHDLPAGKENRSGRGRKRNGRV